MSTLESEPKLFRQVLGRFASGVTVITTRHGDDVHGMTANAFMSASLQPPLILISVGQRARMRALIEESGVFGVSVLADEHELHSRHFSGQHQLSLSPEFLTIDGIPVLTGALATITARVGARHGCGDHTLFVGGVEHVAMREGKPLVFFNGAYRSLEERP